ncbi:hypothetical protein E5Q_03401 [Mixia osmundae IAM 14324]|uniref:Uncharacterized protein n=1 Tax=Mixia osmundae (strain CBS 9802 / IAM 14324 / JCM 22182 / KY 12970) TaxID=764103 RepID=G7E1M0_MIXOS|nr:hypothetical protein E5Q_03401 [Mixia osmundae IAM 14324]
MLPFSLSILSILPRMHKRGGHCQSAAITASDICSQRTRTQKAQNRVSIVYKPQRGSAFDDARLRPISRRIEDIARSLRRVTWLERQTQLSPTLREDDDSFVLVPPAPVELVKIRPATQLRQRRVSQTNLTRIRSHGSRPHKLTKPDPSKLRRAADKPSHIPHKLSIDRAGCFGMKPDSPKSRTAAADRSDACAWPITTNTAMSTSVDPPDGAATFVCVEGNRSELARASAYLMLTGRPPPKRHLPPPKPRWSSPPPMQAAPRRLFRRGRPRFDQVDTLLDRARARWQ